MSKVWTSEELARECKNCEVASAARIRSQAETIRKLREMIAQLNRDSICRERVIRGLKHAVKMACTKRDENSRALDMKSKALHTFYRLATLQQIDLREIGDRLEVLNSTARMPQSMSSQTSRSGLRSVYHGLRQTERAEGNPAASALGEQ